jgi:hypothetical protein
MDRNIADDATQTKSFISTGNMPVIIVFKCLLPDNLQGEGKRGDERSMKDQYS